MNCRYIYIQLFVLFMLISGIAFAKNKIYLANNSAAIAIEQTAESSFNLQITLSPEDNFINWDLGFFMLHVFLSQNKAPFSAQICKQNICMPLILDVVNKIPAKNQTDYLKPELSSGHISLFKPINSFPLEDGRTYVISINGLKGIPKNITAMPQSLFISDTNHADITPFLVSVYTGYDKTSKLQQNIRTQYEWYALKSPAVIDSIVVPYPVKTIFMPGTSKLDGNVNNYYCKLSESIPQCIEINNQAEGYVLQIGTAGVMIYANTPAGIFYARQTLGQLSNYYSGNVPNQTVIDYPRFKYRGFMLDTVRHFFNVAEIKQLLDIMAAHKLNVLHLHLADDEAWRVQLPHYPQLTLIGSSRVFKGRIGPSNLVDGKYDISNFSGKVYAKANTIYEGYYSIADIRNLIAYANARQITIIPEIEMPGHSKALKKAMPEVFFDASDQSRYLSVQGYNDSVVPICKYGNDSVFTTTVNGIIQDIAALFAEQTTLNYQKNEVSLSGDEVPQNAFSGYAMCNVGIYKNLPKEAITYEFLKQLSDNLPGYKLSGWQQLVQLDDGSISHNTLDPKLTGHIWQWLPTNNRPVSGLDTAANLSKSGYPTVLDFANLSYFDQRYSTKWDEPGLYWAANQTDTFSALITALSTNNITDTSNVIGIEGALWSELIPGDEHLFYMAIPKMSGLADAAWARQQDISWRSLAVRLGCGKSGFLAYLNKQYNIRYRGYPDGIKLEVPSDKLCN